MTAKLTLKQERFAIEYLIDLNATQASIRAGYSKNSAKQTGSRLMTNDDIKHYIEERTRAISRKSIVDATWLLDHLGAIATADVLDILNDDGTYKPVSEWPLIPPEHQARVFDRFHRVDPAHTVPGTGLGLSIVKEIITTHGGTVRLDSTFGEGSTFVVSLPCLENSGS